MSKILILEEMLVSLKLNITELFEHISSLEKSKKYLNIEEPPVSKIYIKPGDIKNFKFLHPILDKIHTQLEQINHTVKLLKYNSHIKSHKKILTKLSIKEFMKDLSKHHLIKTYDISYIINNDFIFRGNLIFFELMVIDILKTLYVLTKNHLQSKITIKTKISKNANKLILELHPHINSCASIKQFTNDKKFISEFKSYTSTMRAFGVNLTYQFKKSIVEIVFQFPTLEDI